MKVVYKSEKLSTVDSDLILLPYVERKRNRGFDFIDKELGGALAVLASKEEFRGQAGRSLIWQGELSGRSIRVVFVGVGESSKDPPKWRRAIARGVRYAKGHRVSSIAVFIDRFGPEQDKLHVRWTVEALKMAVYQFDKYKSGKKDPILPDVATVSVYPSPQNSTALRYVATRAAERTDGVALARDLVNEPANVLGPTQFAQQASELALKEGLECIVLNEKDLREMGADLIRAVGAGSSDKPSLVHLIHRPKRKKKATVAFIGKGVTFDSGGLCIKPGKSMETMKTDMAGAAATLAVMSTLGKLSIAAEVHGVIPLAENSVGSTAMRPGDIFRSLSGLTVEITNTDAEGRLILADALTYTLENAKPDVVIDHATLTGACTVALGLKTAGLFSNSDTYARQYLTAALKCGEPFWRLPLSEDIKKELKSSVADLKNAGGRYGGAISAALFLARFVGKTPWIHVDIAGPARLDKNEDLCPKGGSGFGVLTALEFLKSL